MISFSADRVVRLLTELQAAYEGFVLESRLWPQVGARRSPYRTLVLFGLSARTRDPLLVEMCRRFFQQFPGESDLTRGGASHPRLAAGLVRPGQIPFVESMALALRRGVPKHREELVEIKGVGEKIAECVLAYGWGQEALPIDTHCMRVLRRVSGDDRPPIRSRDPRPLREKLKCVYLNQEQQFKDQSISMVDIHEILRLHGQICCTKTPTCSACPVSGCLSRREPPAMGRRVDVPLAFWDDWRELINEPGPV